MSPIFENKKIILGNTTQENLSSGDAIMGWGFILFSIILFFSDNLVSLLFCPLGFFIVGFEPMAKAAKKSAISNFEITYDLICSEATKLSKKKDLSSTEVDKRVNNLITEQFDYEEVLDVIGFTEDSLNHKLYLKKKS